MFYNQALQEIWIVIFIYRGFAILILFKEIGCKAIVKIFANQFVMFVLHEGKNVQITAA